jgi:hypothetical protein
MGVEMSQEDAVWAETTDGGLLRQLFGYYPTLHDATVVSIEIDRAADRMEMVLDYEDMVGEDVTQHLCARIRLQWDGIESFDLPLGYEDLMGLDFGRKGERILTTLEVWPGVFGSVVSDSVEAILVQMDPGESDGKPHLRLK